MSIINVMAGIGSMIITNNRILLSQQKAQQMDYERQQIVNRKNIEKKQKQKKHRKKSRSKIKT